MVSETRGFQTRCFPWLLLPTPAEAVLGLALHACLDDEAAATAARPNLRRRFRISVLAAIVTTADAAAVPNNSSSFSFDCSLSILTV